MRSVAEQEGFSTDDFTPLKVDLGSFASVREFCGELNKAKLNRPIDRMICNAAVYQPGDVAEWSVDGHPQTMQVNFLSHFLMISLLFKEMIKSAANPHVILVGGTAAAGLDPSVHDPLPLPSPPSVPRTVHLQLSTHPTRPRPTTSQARAPKTASLCTRVRTWATSTASRPG